MKLLLLLSSFLSVGNRSLLGVLFYFLLAFYVGSCTEPNADNIRHSRKLVSILDNENTEIEITYNELGKVSFVDNRYLVWGVKRLSKSYTAEGQLHEVRGPDTSLLKRFIYPHSKGIRGRYTIPSPINSDPCAGRFLLETMSKDGNGVLSYTIKPCLSRKSTPAFVVSRQISKHYNVEAQQMTERKTSSILYEEIFEYDQARNPFFGINYFDPFEMLNFNRNNIISKIDLREGEVVLTHLYEYEYERGYPVRRIERVYDGDGVMVSEKQEQYFYD